MNRNLTQLASSVLKNALNQVPYANPFLYWTDSYKISHIDFEIEGVSEIYSNFTARFDKYMKSTFGTAYDGKFVVFGIQWMILRLQAMAKIGFFDRDLDEVIAEMKATLGPYIGQERYDQFVALHELGYLPVEIKAVDEGTVLPIGTPFMTIKNTLPEFEWLSNYLESGISMETWKPITVASIGRIYRNLSNDFALETTGSSIGAEFQNHDFGTRGQSGFESNAINGVAFLLSTMGTDNLGSLWAAKNFYGTPSNGLAMSVPAGEHSVTTLGILTTQERQAKLGNVIDLKQAEYLYLKWLLSERFTKGIFSYVSDSFDYWTLVTEILPMLKDEIMCRDGKLVVRGDSGNPVHIIAGYRIKKIADTASAKEMMEYAAWEARKSDGVEVIEYKGKYHKILNTDFGGLADITEAEAKGTIETLSEIFGYTYSDNGYKVLDSHIGMIYGDGITVQRSRDILTRLKNKQFASTNIVFGVGSYSLNMLSRDFLGMAIKATNAIVDVDGDDVDKPIYKDPKTDQSKKSARGLIRVFEDEDGTIKFEDNVSREAENTGLLTTVFENGILLKVTDVDTIRKLLWK